MRDTYDLHNYLAQTESSCISTVGTQFPVDQWDDVFCDIPHPPRVCKCGKIFEDGDFAYACNDGKAYCEDCSNKLCKATRAKAATYAKDYFKITKPLEVFNSDFNPLFTFDCYINICLHNHTNYDELIANLSGVGDLDAIYEEVILKQFQSLIADEIEELDLVQYGKGE